MDGNGYKFMKTEDSGYEYGQDMDDGDKMSFSEQKLFSHKSYVSENCNRREKDFCLWQCLMYIVLVRLDIEI